MSKHFHLISGFAGCLPEFNVFFENRKEAIEYLRSEVNDLDQEGNKFEKISTDIYVCTRRSTFLGDYLQVTECQEPTCQEDDE